MLQMGGAEGHIRSFRAPLFSQFFSGISREFFKSRVFYFSFAPEKRRSFRGEVQASQSFEMSLN